MAIVKWPQELVDEISDRRVVLFFGSGVSANCLSSDKKRRPPTWRSFLLSASTRVPRKLKASVKGLMEQNNLLLACDVIREAVGRDVFKRLLREFFHDPGYGHSEVHGHLLRIDAKVSITPNFDTIYDTYLSAATSNTVLVKNYYDEDIADALRSKYSTVIKLHGTITAPDKLIFTLSDYAQARSTANQVYDLVRALLCTHTFLFIGCGLDDPDIKLLLEDYRYKHASGGKHYFLCPRGYLHPEVLGVIGRTLNLNFVGYENSAGDHSNFGESLRILVEQVELARASGGV
ncbi:SIR2 family protein [Stenotrophomonas maltophilia]|uniref:SIR2 family protein n=1 Tax=Stenotrophomonas maltophilia TaxID=40324 RepID=UPI0009C0BBF1|nr:SIR2 family protein [Stenotrophomonas maltophilia]